MLEKQSPKNILLMMMYQFPRPHDTGRQFRNAQNIEVDNPQGVFGDFHNSHNRVEDWENKIIQSTKSHK